MTRLVCALLLAASAARAEGFFVRPEAGIGVLHTATDNGGVSSVSGPSFSISLGGALSESVSLGARVSALAARTSFYLAGPELTVRAPLGLDASAGIAVTSLVLESGARAPNGGHPLPDGRATNMGFGATLTLAREWQAGSMLALGVAAHAAAAWNDDRGWNAPTWVTRVFGFSLRAAFR